MPATGINPPLEPTAGGAGLVALALALCVVMAILLVDGGPSALSVPTSVPPIAAGVLEGESTPLLTIPDADASGASDSLVVQESATVSAVTVELVVTHDYPEEIAAELVSPSGTVAELYSAEESPPQRFDSADTPGLAALAGEQAQGEWTLRLADDVEDDEGTLESWSLTIETG